MKLTSDAPVWYSEAEATAWVCGYDSGTEEARNSILTELERIEKEWVNHPFQNMREDAMVDAMVEHLREFIKEMK